MHLLISTRLKIINYESSSYSYVFLTESSLKLTKLNLHILLRLVEDLMLSCRLLSDDRYYNMIIITAPGYVPLLDLLILDLNRFGNIMKSI